MAGTNSAGNNRKARQQHELDGTYRKDRHADLRSPEPQPGPPDEPATLDSLAQEEWRLMLVDLEDMGLLHKVDRSVLYQYCKLYSETERVAQEQSETRESVRILEENVPDVRRDEPGKLVELYSEIVTLRKLISKCTDQLRSGRVAIRQYLVEFGLTPASRGRIKLPAKREEVDAFSAFQQKRGAA